MNLDVVNPYRIIETLQEEVRELKKENESLKEQLKGDENGILADTDNE